VAITLATTWFLVVVGLLTFFLASLRGYKAVAVIGGMLVVAVGATAMVDGGIVVQAGEVVTTTADGTVTEPQYRELQVTDSVPLEVLILLLGSVLTLRGIDSVGSQS